MKQSFNYYLTLASVLLFSCTTQVDEPFSPPNPETPTQRTFNIKQGFQPASQDIKSLENNISSISAYLFNGQELVTVFDDLTGFSHSLSVKLENEKDTKLYFIANPDQTPQVRDIKVGSIKLDDFLILKSNSQNTLLPDFLSFSGVTPLVASNSTSDAVQLSRGMSRLDLVLKPTEISVSKIKICNTQSQGYIFEQKANTPSEHIDLERSFVVPVTSDISEVGYINEQRNNDLYALVDYTYKGVTDVVKVKLPNTIERNSNYQVILQRSSDPEPPVNPPVDPPKPDKIVGYVRVIAWNDGGDHTATPDSPDKTSIEVARTVLPSKATLNALTSTINFSRDGGRAVVYFSGKYDKTIQVISSNPNLTVTPGDDTYRNNSIVINASQTIENPEYTVKVKIKKAYIPSDIGVELTINVASKEIEHVVMGGLKWMMVNGIGSSPTLYPLLKDGQTARDFYRTNWKDHTAMTVWGPRPTPGPLPQLWPWQSETTTNIGGGDIFGDGVVSWLPAHGNLPCPTGWRLPTIDECKRIWPTDSANKTYDMNGVSYTSSIENSGHPDITLDGTTTTATAKIFVISDGKQDLIFPIAGWRRAGLTSPVHAHEIGIYLNLWVMNRGSNGYSTPTIGVRGDQPYLSSVGGDADWVMANAYKNSRCVKDL